MLSSLMEVSNCTATVKLLLNFLLSGTVFYSDLVHVCTSLGKSSTMPAIFYAPAAFEAFVFIMTAYRAVKDAKLITGAGRAPFLTVLYRGAYPS
jgi:hypothetical protein